MSMIMGMRFKEIEKILLADGWKAIAQKVHPTKPGKVTVPDHRGDVNPYIVKSIWKQAGINEKRTK